MTLNITTIMRIKNIFMATLLGVMLHSCEFLDVVPDDTSTLDDAFKTETNAGNFKMCIRDRCLSQCFSF